MNIRQICRVCLMRPTVYYRITDWPYPPAKCNAPRSLQYPYPRSCQRWEFQSPHILRCSLVPLIRLSRSQRPDRRHQLHTRQTTEYSAAHSHNRTSDSEQDRCNRVMTGWMVAWTRSSISPNVHIAIHKLRGLTSLT